MGRVIAIDFGKKRTGVAVTDELKIIASGLDTIETSKLFPFLIGYITDEKVETLIIGLPKTLDDKLNEIELDIQKLIQKLQKKFPDLKIERIDERFTSKLAFDTMLQSGISKKKRRDKALVDKISATIILQSYLEKNTL